MKRTITTELELYLFAALKRITAYQSPDRLRRIADKEYGLAANEAIEMAYENVIEEARSAVKGIRVQPSATEPEGSDA